MPFVTSYIALADFGSGRGQLDLLAPDDYDTAGPHHVTYHLTCGVFLVSCPSSDVRPHLQWTHGMLGMAAMSMCLSSCLTLSLLIGIKLRLPGGGFTNLIDQQCGSGVEELCYLVTCLACLRGDWASTAQGEAKVQVLPSVAVKALRGYGRVTVNPIPSHPNLS